MLYMLIGKAKGDCMTTTAKVSRKWQIVVPKDVRQSLDLKPGDRLHFQVTDSGVKIGKGDESPFDRYFGYLGKKCSTDKIIKEMRGDR